MENLFSIVQLNTEGGRQNDLEAGAIARFLKAQNPDLIFLQEVFVRDVKKWARLLKMAWAFLPMLRIEKPGVHKRMESKGEWGVAILSKASIVRSRQEYYEGNGTQIEEYRSSDCWNAAYGVLITDTTVCSTPIRVATTHFPVTLNGAVDERQLRLWPEVESILWRWQVELFTGDLNIPTINPLGQQILSTYNVAKLPENETSSLTPLHRTSPHPDLIVDYVITPKHEGVVPVVEVMGPVELNKEVSDHAALKAKFRINSGRRG